MSIQRVRLTETYKELAPHLESLELERKDLVLKIALVFCLCFGILIIAYSYVQNMPIPSYQLPVMIVVGLVSIIAGLVNRLLIHPFKREFKFRVVEQVFKRLLPDCIYDSNGKIPQSDYMMSLLFPRYPDIYQGEDFVKARIGQTEFEFSELKTFFHSRDNKGRKRKVIIFKGLFFIADFHKNFSGQTFVLPDYAERSLGDVGNILQSMIGKVDSRPGELVKLEDPAFEKYFKVYSTDQLEARYILSASMMQRVLDLKQKMKSEISISFVNSRVFVAIHSKKNMFEPNIFRSIKRFELIHEFAEDFKFTCEIVEELNLNTRIWTKN